MNLDHHNNSLPIRFKLQLAKFRNNKDKNNLMLPSKYTYILIYVINTE